MKIVNRVLKDKKNLTYTYTCVCRDCGNTITIVKPRKQEIEISQLPCDKCEKPIPQVVIPEVITPKQVFQPKAKTPVKKVKPTKKNRKR